MCPRPTRAGTAKQPLFNRTMMVSRNIFVGSLDYFVEVKMKQNWKPPRWNLIKEFTFVWQPVSGKVISDAQV